MIYIECNAEGKVIYRHNKPFHEEHGLKKTREQLEQEGLLVEQLPPKLPELKGKTQELYYNNGELQWQYEDIPLEPKDTEEQRIAELEGVVMELTTVIAILAGGAE